MAKDRENQECPCGSGKQAIACCHRTNVISFDINRHNNILSTFQQSFHDFVLTGVQELISDEVYAYFPTISDRPEDFFDAYYAGMSVWVTACTAVDIFNDNTVISHFIEKNKSLIKSKRVKSMVISWADNSPSVFEVTNINQSNNLIEAIDLFTEETFTIKMDTIEGCSVGSVIAGSLIAHFGYHRFLMDEVYFKRLGKEKLQAAISLYKVETDHFASQYPFILKHLLEIEYAVDHRHNIIFEVISHGIIEQMMENGFDPMLTNIALSSWERYSEQKAPSIKNPNHYIAAIEFLILDAFLGLDFVSGREFAKENSVPFHVFQQIYLDILAFVQTDALLFADFFDSTNDLAELEEPDPKPKQVIQISDFLKPKK